MFFKDKIRKYLISRLGVPEASTALKRLANIGFEPVIIFDVGAYRGDFARLCAHIWPQAKIVCFEPQENKVIELHRLSGSLPSISVFPVLLGANAESGKVALHESGTASSVLSEHIPQHFPVKFYPMRSIDDIVQKDLNNQYPDLLKIDVQGYELEVLKGAEKSLSRLKLILAELNLLDIHKNTPLLHEVIQWLSERGWVAYDICGLIRRPLDNALWQVDFIFVPYDSPFRADKHWKSL